MNPSCLDAVNESAGISVTRSWRASWTDLLGPLLPMLLVACGGVDGTKPAPASRVAAHYTITEILGPNGEPAECAAINNRGTVLCGACKVDDRTLFLWNEARGVFETGPDGAGTLPLDINDSNVYVALDGSGSCVSYSFVGVQMATNAGGGGYTVVPPPPNSSEFEAQGINDAGVFVGDTGNGTDDIDGTWLYQDGVYGFLDARVGTGRSFFGSAVNDAGMVAGCVNNRAAVLDGQELTDLGSLGGSACASDINAEGTVVGSSELSPGGRRHPFAYIHGEFRDLGTLGGELPAGNTPGAWRVNDGGIVVGWAPPAGGSNGAAFAWTESDGMVDLTQRLGDDRWELWTATGVNNHGQIAGVGIHDDNYVGFMMTPSD